MCVRGFLPLTLPSKPLLGAERGQNPPLLPGQMGSGGCRPGDPHCNPPLLLSTLSQGTKPWVGSPPLTRLYTESIGASPTRVGGAPPPITRSPCCQGNPTRRRWSLMQDV